MNVSGPDVHQILEYRADTAFARLLPTGLGLCFLGLLGLALLDGDRDFQIILAIGILLAAGPGIVAFALFKRSNRGKPVFVLSPMGVHYRIPWVKEFLIPWREIRGIDTIDITTSNWSYRNPGTMTFSNVTAVLVPKPFYDARIHVGALLLRGPGWEANFIPKGDLVQVALHHELVSAEPRALREAVEARWHAFRDQSSPIAAPAAAENKRASVPSVKTAWKKAIRRSEAPPPGIAMGDNPKTMSTWDTVLIIAALIGIAVVSSNLLGLWATEGQTKAHDARKEWEAWDRKLKDESKKRDQEQKERDQRFQEIFRRM
jgi:hypothetical protein